MKKTMRRLLSLMLTAVLLLGAAGLYAGSAAADDSTVYVHFHDHEPAEGQKDSILHTTLVSKGETYAPRPTDVAVSERSEDNIILVVTGWKDADGNVYDENHPVPTDGENEIHLYPVMSKGAWIFFDTAGGVYLDPQFVPYGEPTKEETTTRDGYTLDGWYDGEEPFVFGNTLDTVKTLTAKWTANRVKYHVEVWQEAPTYSDDSYYLEDTIEAEADAGETVTMDQLRTIAEDYVMDHWNGRAFVLNEEKTQPYADTAVEGDGSTVLRIYMDRTRHTLIVYDLDGSEIKRIENVKYDVDDWTYAGFTFWNDEVWSDARVAEINAVEGENNLSKYYWDPSWWTGFLLDPDTYNMHFRWMRSTLGFPEVLSITPTERPQRYRYVINNYFEYLDDETLPAGAELVEHTDANGVTKQYYLDTSYAVWLTSANNGSVQVGPDGFHLVRGEGNTVNGNGEVLSDVSTNYYVYGMSTDTPTNIFYTRNIRTVRYIPGKNYEDTVYEDSVPFNDLISKYPAKDGLVADETTKTVENVTYIFKGWSQTENGEPISAEDYAKMRVFPDKDYTFYGIWKPLEYTVVFDPAGGKLNGEASVTVESGNSVAQPADPENGEMQFVGWYTDSNAPYYFGTLLTEEVVAELGDGDKTVTLHARYSDFPGNPVKYYLNGGTGKTPVREPYYCSGAAFPAAETDGIVPPENKVFAGWETADGTVYQPGDALIVNPEYVKDGEIPLTAIWEEVPPTGERTAAPFWTLLLFASIGGLMFAGKRRCSSEE